VIYRTQRGDAVFDRRVSSGLLEGAGPLVGPEGVLRALGLALEDLGARYGFPTAAGGPGAPGGGGGRSDMVTADEFPTVPLSVVRDDP